MADQDEGKADEREPSQELEAIRQFGGWIQNADVKAGLIATGLAVLLAGLSQQSAEIGMVLSGDHDQGCLALILLLVTAASLLVTAGVLGVSLFPNFPRAPQRNRFSFAFVAGAGPDDAFADDAGGAVVEARLQAHELAVIARRKFRLFRVALVAFGFALVSFGAWTAASTLLPA